MLCGVYSLTHGTCCTFYCISDLTLIPPPKTPDEENLIDFSSMEIVNAPPPGFSDDSSSSSGNSPPQVSQVMDEIEGAGLPLGMNLPADLEDLPPSIRDRIDNLVMNDQELGNQLATIDALLLGENYSTNNTSLSPGNHGNQFYNGID